MLSKSREVGRTRRLRETAKSLGVKGYSRMNKRELERAIYEARCDALDGAKGKSQPTAKSTTEQTIAAVQSATTAEEPVSGKFEVGKVYVSMSSYFRVDTHETHAYISNAYLVMKRTAKYITVKDISPISGTGEIKRFYVHNNEIDGTTEYFCQSKSSVALYQHRINANEVVDEADVKQQMRPEVKAKVYPDEVIAAEINPDYDAAFDKPAYKPNVQEVSVIVDDIPADHESDMQEDSEISSYVVGKQIVSLKGDAKAQQALLKSCGDEFLLAMFGVFYAPVRVHMDTPDELRKWMCKGVLKAVRDPSYAGILLRNVRIDIKKKTHVKRAYLEGWAKFLSEYACPADQQGISAVLDDIPADHESDTAPVQEASATTYEAVSAAYDEYYKAQWWYRNSNETDMSMKEKADEAYRRYLTLLGKYRRGAMPEREEALNWVRARCSESDLPIKALDDVRVDTVIVLSHKCGIHAAAFQNMSSTDMVIRLLREAGINPGFRTSYENAVEARKEIRRELHKTWQTRKVMRKALRLLGEDSDDAQILRDMCAGDTTRPANSRRIENMLREYRNICRICAEGRRYEAESNSVFLAPVPEAQPIIESESHETKAQAIQTSKPKTTIIPKKKTRKASRKPHRPSWVKPMQLTSKPRKHIPNPKPLMKASRIASTVRIRKF